MCIPETRTRLMIMSSLSLPSGLLPSPCQCLNQHQQHSLIIGCYSFGNSMSIPPLRIVFRCIVVLRYHQHKSCRVAQFNTTCPIEFTLLFLYICPLPICYYCVSVCVRCVVSLSLQEERNQSSFSHSYSFPYRTKEKILIHFPANISSLL